MKTPVPPRTLPCVCVCVWGVCGVCVCVYHDRLISAAKGRPAPCPSLMRWSDSSPALSDGPRMPSLQEM